MPSRIKEKLEDTMEKAISIALTPFDYVLTYFFIRKMHLRREIAKDVLISPDWTVITPQLPMEIKKRFQDVSLVLENCKKTFGKYQENLMFSDGTVINPAKQIFVEIFDEDGTKYELKSRSYSMGNFDEKNGTFFVIESRFKPYKMTLPRDKTFKEVRIRSDKPFQVKKIIWHDYDRK